MEKIEYTSEKMNSIKEQVQKMIAIVSELERDFPGRHFTLDGHLVGSIGEVMAAYYYGIELYKASTEIHDGEVAGRKVQIKMAQQDNIEIAYEPDYLIVLYLNKNGNIYEVYNGKGKEAWESASKPNKNNKRHMRVNKLMELDRNVDDSEHIKSIHTIEKMRTEYKNKKKTGK